MNAGLAWSSALAATFEHATESNESAAEAALERLVGRGFGDSESDTDALVANVAALASAAVILSQKRLLVRHVTKLVGSGLEIGGRFDVVAELVAEVDSDEAAALASTVIKNANQSVAEQILDRLWRCEYPAERVWLGLVLVRPESTLSFLASTAELTPQSRSRCLLLILHAIALHYTLLDPALVAASTLLPSLILIARNDSTPSILATTFSILSLAIPLIRVNLSPTDLSSLLHVLIRAIHWEVVMNAVFRVTKESDDGSDVQIEDSKEVVLQMLDLDASDEFWGSSSLLQSIIADPPTTASIADIQQDTLKTLFATTSATIVRRSVDSLYTILYALFPHSTLNQLRTSFSPNVELTWLQEVETTTRPNSPRSQPKYAPSVNPFHAPMIRLLELEVLDESFLVRQRVTFLIRAHRMHPILVFGGGREEEVRGIKESGGRGCNEVLVECLLLRAASDGEGIRSGNTSDKLDVNTVLSVNRALRKSALEQTAPTRALTKSHTSPHILSPHPYHHTTLLLADLHYDLCLRSALLHQITLLKREKPIHILSTTDRENVFQKLRSQQQEISHLTAALEQVRAESAVMRERHRKYEEDLNRRVRSAREAAKEAKEELESFVKTREGEVEALKKELEESHRRIHHLEQEIHLAEPDLERLAASEAAIKTLNNKFVQHEMDSSTRQALLKQIEEMESQLLAHEILLAEAEKREKGLKERVEALEAAAAGTSLIEISEFEALKIQHKKALDDVRSSNLDRIKVVEEKYQTVNEINLALEMRVMELEAGRG